MKCPKCQADNTHTARFCSNCATSLTSADDAQSSFTKTLETPVQELTRGTLFAGRYEIIEELGKGGMGKVYRALDKKLKEEVALKLIRPDIAKDKNTVERFQNELKLARKISHRNVGRMYELLEEGGIHYITMEYVPGQDLRGLIRQSGRLAIPTAISIAKQLCDGLSEAHQLGVVHRDLKPSNAMINKEGNAKIMDFGIARSLKGKGITGQGVIIGTPEYMSPEQVEAKDVDERSDIYSFGVILFEMLTGQLPFEGDTPLSIAVQHRSDVPKNPREFNAQIPENLSRLILKCLEKEKEKRYQNTEEVKADLAQIEQGIPTTERETARKKSLTSKEITVSFSPKKLLIPLVVVLAVLIAALIILKPWLGEKSVPIPTDRPSIAVLPFENNTGDENQDQLSDSLSDQLTADLYQSKHLHVLSAPQVYGILKGLNFLQAEKFSYEDLRDIGNRGGVSYLLTGSYAIDGNTFLITVTLNRRDSAQDSPSFTVEGPSAGNIGTLVDDITTRIKAELNISQTKLANDIDSEAARITSSSTEALKLYGDARRKHYDGDYPGAIQLFKKAITIDPEFAMAYRGMSASYWAIGAYPDKARNLLQEALDLGERLPERESLLIQGNLASNSWRLDEAEAAFTELLERHPDDWGAHHGIGLVYRRMEETEKAIESYEKAIKYKSESYATYGWLSSIYRSQGLFDKADEVIKLYVDNFGYSSAFHCVLAEQLMLQGDLEPALNEINKAISSDATIPRAIIAKGDIHFYRGELVEAEEWYQKLLQQEEAAYYSYGLARLSDLCSLQGKFKASKEKVIEGIERAEETQEKYWVLNWHSAFAYLEFVSDNFEQALREWDRTLDIAAEYHELKPQPFYLSLKGLTYLGLGSVDSAQEIANELKQFIEQNEIDDTSDYDFLLGSIELELKNYSHATRLFEKALVDWDTVIPYLYSAAQAYYREEDLEMAQKKCEKILSLTSMRFAIGYPRYFDLYAKSYYMLGKIYEKKGWPGKAIEFYEKFLSLWKDADPGIAEVEDARERVAGLKQ